MIEFIHKNNSKNLIIFIHGLTGGNDTWKNDSTGKTLPELLLLDVDVNSNFDMAYFEYYSSFLNCKEKVNIIKSLFSSDKSTPKNLSIKEISELLRTRIDYELIEYDSIIFVAHSMGGLIAKNIILHYLNKSSKIKLFLSLAVPHLGSDKAIYGNFISGNPQLKDLKVLSDETMNLLNQWLESTNLPLTKYFKGMYEGTVPIHSAIPAKTKDEDIINADENHRTISKPKDERSIVVISTVKILKEFLKNSKVDDIDYGTIISDEYDDEYFVLKLIIADVHDSIINDSKKHFYFSEEIRKIFTSNSDKKVLKELYARIESLYNNVYGDYITEKITTSTELVNEVHKKIIEEDSEFLEIQLSKVSGLHKKGMIHQLANDIDRNIFWSDKNYTIEELDNTKGNNDE